MERFEQDNVMIDNNADDDNAAIAVEEELEMLASRSSSSDNSSNDDSSVINPDSYSVDFLESCVVRYPDVAVLYLAGLNRIENDPNDAANYRRSMVVYVRYSARRLGRDRRA